MHKFKLPLPRDPPSNLLAHIYFPLCQEFSYLQTFPVALTLSGKEKRNRVGFFSTALLQELLHATGTPGTQGALLIDTPALVRAMCPPGIGQSAVTLIYMHPLGRGWRKIRASACAVAHCLWQRCTRDRRHLLGASCLHFPTLQISCPASGFHQILFSFPEISRIDLR